MFAWLESSVRAFIQRSLNNERGQEVIVWLLVILLVWLIVTGRRLLVQ